MEASTKIALGIVASAALLLFGYIGYSEFQRHRDMAYAQAALDRIGLQGRNVVAQLQAASAADQARQREASLLAWSRRALLGDQRCVGGIVVVASGTTYTQLGTVGDPVRCSGHYADRPIR